MARLTDEQWELLEADYNTGRYSKNQLADKYNISHTAVNKRFKDIEPKFQDLVSTQIAIKSELANQSFKQVSAIETAVDEAIRNKNLVFGVTQKALKKASEMIESIEDANDLKAIVDLSDKASITLGVNQRHANTTINNTNAQQNNTKFVGMRRMSDEEKREALEQNDR